MNAKPKRRWFQFGLRAFLLAFTLLSLWLGFATQRAAEQKRAIAAIRRRGGDVIYQHQYDNRIIFQPGTPVVFKGRVMPWLSMGGYQINYEAPPPGPAWLRSLLGDDYFQTVYQVNMRSCNDDDLDLIAALPDVKQLRLGGVEIANDGLRHIAKINSLESLSLTAIMVTDEGLRHLESLANLKEVSLETNASSDAVARLRSALPNCKVQSANKRSFSAD